MSHFALCVSHAVVSRFVMLVSLRIVCETGPMRTLKEGAVIATIGDVVILCETPFRYQVDFYYFFTILIARRDSTIVRPHCTTS